jgi:hypothetical protein
MNTKLNTSSFFVGIGLICGKRKKITIAAEMGLIHLYSGENSLFFKTNTPNVVYNYNFQNINNALFGVEFKYQFLKLKHIETYIVIKLNSSSKVELKAYHGNQPISQPDLNLIYLSMGIQTNFHL